MNKSYQLIPIDLAGGIQHVYSPQQAHEICKLSNPSIPPLHMFHVTFLTTRDKSIKTTHTFVKHVVQRCQGEALIQPGGDDNNLHIYIVHET